MRGKKDGAMESDALRKVAAEKKEGDRQERSILVATKKAKLTLGMKGGREEGWKQRVKRLDGIRQQKRRKRGDRQARTN